MHNDLIDNSYDPYYRPKEKLVAALFAFFLGTFGAHHFYLGNKGLGILYLVFFWTMIPSIIAFIEGILLLVKEPEDFDYKYNKERYLSRMQQQRSPRNPRRNQDPYAQEERRYEIPEDQTGKISIADEIEKLHELMVKGIISEREFAERKDRLF